jgi:hypothetical protein
MYIGISKSITITSDDDATTTEPSFSASFIDNLVKGGSLPGDNDGALTGATAVTAVGSPDSGSQSRELKELIVYNRDTVSRTITVSKVSGGVSYPLAAYALGAGESLVYDGGWKVLTAAGEVKSSALGSASSSAGTKNGATVTAAENGTGVVHQTVLTLTATPITISDDADTAQYGGVKVYTLPEGHAAILGAVVSGELTAGVTGTIIDNWDGDVALGTVTATTGSTLTGTEANILPSASVSAGAADKIGVVAAASAATALTESGARWLDGSTTPVPVFLNFVIDDDATHEAGTAAFTGTITLTWINLGDY